MTTKKKLIAIGLCLVILAATILNGTAAYFTDEQGVTNTFTSGNVEIKLEETKADNSGTITSGTNAYGKVYPGQTVVKDPVITNTSSTEDAYIAAKVTVTDGDGDLRHQDVIPDANNGIAIKELLKGGILDSATFVTDVADIEAELAANNVVYQAADPTNGTYTFYFFVKGAVPTTGENSVTLFETMTIPADWDNEEMDQIKQLTIDVKAYGVQTFGFDNSYDALVATFFEELKLA